MTIPIGTICEVVARRITGAARRMGARRGRLCEVTGYMEAPEESKRRGMVNLVRLPGQPNKLWASDAALKPLIPWPPKQAKQFIEVSEPFG